MNDIIETKEIREYDNNLPVEIFNDPENEGRLVLKAYTEAGFACTIVDIVDLVEWIKKNKPELLK